MSDNTNSNNTNRHVFASRPGSLFDVGSAIGGDSGCLGSTLGLGLGSTFGSTTGGGGGGGSSNPVAPPPPPTGGTASRSVRHQHPAGSGILSEFALSALSANGGGGSSELSVAIGGRGGGAAGGGGGGGGGASVAGGRAAAASASAQHALQYLGSPLPLSPATRAGVVPPGSVLSSFASPGSASLRWVFFQCVVL